VVRGETPATSCIRSPAGGVEGALVDLAEGAVGLWAVSDREGLSCVVQVMNQGPGAYTSVSAEEYALCKAQVHAAIETSGLTECQLYDPDACHSETCETQSACGIIHDGCGNSLDCGPCAD
jgi:hypothetical protein